MLQEMFINTSKKQDVRDFGLGGVHLRADAETEVTSRDHPARISETEQREKSSPE